ncbi:uncharacterized protein VDAG_09117 [Verticillium dahliae VdLs.17]|uniref:Secreted protein n=1 Tax=Verticillium dahliae (strain VdLs.17 / ATCC MYA-4575 / FGSC 10137) TaxID=498257 RepID=G2XFJ3_VERDV|nr:uncharacterized protein VDAG_09117 [Verticillium dahliae VdLs.17]EGY18591.1 secreted protein [Verticillium dahliae VdLs.17]
MLFSVGLLALAALPSSFGAVIQARQDDPENPPRDPQPPPPGPIFGRAPDLDKRFQPALDFDTDSCYNVQAIGPQRRPRHWHVSLRVAASAGCRNEEMLDRGNVYSRQRCNNGYCVIFYAYYFQKDTATPIDGHRHDWEHIAVWVRQSDSFVTHVAVSQHKGYDIRENSQITWTAAENGKPAIVYHKDSILTHCFRFGSGADAGGPGPENHKNQWITGPLLGYFGWDTVEQRDRMLTHNWEAGSIAIKNENFAENIRKARPAGLVFDENFDDEGTNNI